MPNCPPLGYTGEGMSQNVRLQEAPDRAGAIFPPRMSPKPPTVTAIALSRTETGLAPGEAPLCLWRVIRCPEAGRRSGISPENPIASPSLRRFFTVGWSLNLASRPNSFIGGGYET